MENVNNLISQFIDSTIIRGREMTNNSVLANKHYDVIVNCFCHIRECDNWVDSFSKLLNYPDASVQVTAAYYLLPYKTLLAMLTLIKWTLKSSSESFNAKMILEQWLTGKLKFPELQNGEIVYK